jgi:PAS domain S-box-containing protein
MLSIVRDITAAVSAEAARHVAEERFRQTFAQAPFSVQLLAPDGRTLQVNQAWEALWGVTLADLADYNIRQDPQLAAKGVLPLIEQAFAGEPSAIPAIKYEPAQTLTVPGAVSHRWVRTIAYPVTDPAGAVQEVVLLHEDITAQVAAESALRESETRLRLALQAAGLGIWDWEIVAGTITWSDEVAALHGLPPGAFDGRLESWLSLVHPEDRVRVAAEIAEALARHTVYETEFCISRPDGTTRWLFTQGQAVYDPADQPVRMLGAVLDVTDRKAAEAERERLLAAAQTARAEAEAANRAKDQFLSMLSHELRTPLTTILGFTGLLQRRPLPEDPLLVQALATIERSARLQARLVSDLLDVSRIVTGKLELTRTPLELGPVVTAAVDALRPTAQEHGVGLTVELAAALCVVRGDADRLHQVVSNLVTNAVKFTPAGGQVTVQLARVAETAQLTVTDTGRGIPAAFLPYVFDRFRQADRAHARGQGGLGLGLAIVRSLVELHGGYIRAASAGDGQGACFTVSLPLA